MATRARRSAEPLAIINPEIIVVGSDVIEDWEGCLSIPDIRGRVPRAREIKVRAFDRNGERIELSAHDFPARVIQHETDHLDGVLFFDRMRSFETLTFLDEYARYWRKTKPLTCTTSDERDYIEVAAIRRSRRFFSRLRSDCSRSSSTSE